tara:strand:- start:932 stop:1774 length:843 start_codon:yes stop_codon:yes gene_type:complete
MTCPVYPPGVLQTFTIPDPTSLDGSGELEITLIPSRSVTDINHISDEGIQHFKEMLYEADEEYSNNCALEMNHITSELEAIRLRDEEIWRDNAVTVGAARTPSIWFTLGSEYILPNYGLRGVWSAPWDIRIALEEAEEDFDYEEWINSKEYKDTLKDYNLHKLLAWNKEEEGEHPKWSGEYKQLTQHCWSGRFSNLYNSYIKERYKVEVYVHTLNWGEGGSYYAYGSTPYGDVYVPKKITEYLKDFCGIYEMDIALQDVEETNSFRWTCVYLHNKGFSLE